MVGVVAQGKEKEGELKEGALKQSAIRWQLKSKGVKNYAANKTKDCAESPLSFSLFSLCLPYE